MKESAFVLASGDAGWNVQWCMGVLWGLGVFFCGYRARFSAGAAWGDGKLGVDGGV